MLDREDRQQLLDCLGSGQPPPAELAPQMTVGLDRSGQETHALLAHHVAAGGSAMRIVSSPAGTGKTHVGSVTKSSAAALGFLICSIDVQASRSDAGDLPLYQAFCRGLILPAAHLDGRDEGGGLGQVLEDAARRLTDAQARAAIRAQNLPIRQLEDILVQLLGAARNGLFARDQAARMVLRAIAGERTECRNLAAYRRQWPAAFAKVRALPNGRTARLWLHSMLLALRALGFPGVVIVLDEHDTGGAKALDRSIVQMRHQLDRLSEGSLPGVYILVLVLENFLQQVRASHMAFAQRISPVLRGRAFRLHQSLHELRDLDPEPFLCALADRIHELVVGAPMSEATRRLVQRESRRHAPLGSVDTRGFVKWWAQQLAAPSSEVA